LNIFYKFQLYTASSDGVKDTSLKAKAKTKDFKIVLEDPQGRGLVLEESNTDSSTIFHSRQLLAPKALARVPQHP